MKRKRKTHIPSLSAVQALLLASVSAVAHEGHGLEGAHAHPSDVWGFLMLGLAVGLAVWFSRKK